MHVAKVPKLDCWAKKRKKTNSLGWKVELQPNMVKKLHHKSWRNISLNLVVNAQIWLKSSSMLNKPYHIIKSYASFISMVYVWTHVIRNSYHFYSFFIQYIGEISMSCKYTQLHIPRRNWYEPKCTQLHNWKTTSKSFWLVCLRYFLDCSFHIVFSIGKFLNSFAFITWVVVSRGKDWGGSFMSVKR